MAAPITTCAGRLPNFGVYQSFNDCIEPEVQEHLQLVYTTLAISVLLAVLGSFLEKSSECLQEITRRHFLFCIIIELGLLVAIVVTSPLAIYARRGLLVAFCVLCGMLAQVLDAGVDVFLTALASTFLIFVSFSTVALMTCDTKWLYLQGILLGGLIILLAISLYNAIFETHVITNKANEVLVIVIFTLFILYDTHHTVQLREYGDDDYILHSLNFFLDFSAILQSLTALIAIYTVDDGYTYE